MLILNGLGDHHPRGGPHDALAALGALYVIQAGRGGRGCGCQRTMHDFVVDIIHEVTVKNRALAPPSDLLCSKPSGGTGQEIQADATGIDAPVPVDDGATEVVG